MCIVLRCRGRQSGRKRIRGSTFSLSSAVVQSSPVEALPTPALGEFIHYTGRLAPPRGVAADCADPLSPPGPCNIDITRPSRMSASDTVHSVTPNRRIASRSTRAPPKITSWRPAGRPGRGPARPLSPPRGRHTTVRPPPAGAPRGGSGPFVRHQPELQRGEGRDGARQTHQPGRASSAGAPRRSVARSNPRDGRHHVPPQAGRPAGSAR